MRMFRVRPASVGRRLAVIVTLTSGIALVLAVGALYAYDAYTFRALMTAELNTLADVIGNNCTASLTYNNARDAEGVLAALSETPDVRRAEVYDRHGRLLARYVQAGLVSEPDPARAPAVGSALESGRLVVARTILLDGERIGSVRVVAGTERLTARIQRYGLTALLVLPTAILVGLLLSRGLRRPFTDMVAQIEARDRRLIETQTELEQRVDELQAEVAERKRAQEALVTSEEQLRQAQKMEAIGRLAGGVAHDFNNLLTAVLGYGEIVLDAMPDDDPLKNDVREMMKAGASGAALTRQLLAFGRKQVLKSEVLCLNDVVADHAQILMRLLGEHISVVADLDPLLGLVQADRGQVGQVLLNLAVNARDAMPHGGTLTVRTANVMVDETFVRDHPGAQPGPFVTLTVNDTGCGMTPEVRARLFEPFFTRKERGKGTGLGLATVYGIVKQSGGCITVDSEVDRGSAFTVFLPRAAAGDAWPVECPAREEAARPLRDSRTVLIVEDEEPVRALTTRMLSREGFTVIGAKDGAEALARAEAHGGTIDLLLTDVILPGRSGPEIARSLAEQRPSMKILYMSGYTDDALLVHHVAEGAPLLNKPFKREDLLAMTRRVLDLDIPPSARESISSGQ